MKRNIIVGIVLLVIAVAVGGIAAWFTGEYIEDRKAAFQREIRSQYELVPVVVPGRDMEAGERLVKREMLVREVPKKFVMGSSIRPADFDQFNGRTLRVPVSSGTPLVASFVGQPGSSVGGSFSRTVPEDQRALTVPVTGPSAVAGLLVPGDKVDMLIQTHGRKGPVLLPLLGEVEILATGSNVSARAGQSGNRRGYRSITVQVTPEDAGRITEAQKIGSLVVMLRNPGDSAPMIQEATTPQDVFDDRFDEYIGGGDDPDPFEVEIIQGVRSAEAGAAAMGRAQMREQLRNMIQQQSRQAMGRQQ